MSQIWLPRETRATLEAEKFAKDFDGRLDLSDCLSIEALYKMIVEDWMYSESGPGCVKTIGITPRGDGVFYHPSLEAKHRKRVLRYVAKRLTQAANEREEKPSGKIKRKAP